MKLFILIICSICLSSCAGGVKSEIKEDKEIKCLLSQILAEIKTGNNLALGVNNKLIDEFNLLVDIRDDINTRNG